MMSGNADSTYKRSYNRNVVWCRFWLTIGIAIATLSFTFMAEQGFRPIIESSSDGVEKPESAPADLAADEGVVLPTPSPEDQVKWFDILVFAFLILTSGSCILISYRFRMLYIKDDLALQGLERVNQQEATP